MKRTYYIYTLRNPNNGEIFYVGCTANPKQRLYSHSTCTRLTGNRYKLPHQIYMIEHDIVPVMEIVDMVECEKIYFGVVPNPARALETTWINKFLSEGVVLTNRPAGKLKPQSKYSIGQTIIL